MEGDAIFKNKDKTLYVSTWRCVHDIILKTTEQYDPVFTKRVRTDRSGTNFGRK